MKRSLLLPLIISTTCCVGNPTKQGKDRYFYHCKSGQQITAQYPTTDTAIVRYKNKSLAMNIAISGSGSRYVGDGLEWWTKGSGEGAMGMLLQHQKDGTSGDTIENCEEHINTNKETKMIDSVLTFWFTETTPQQWWATDPSFDALVKQRYTHLLQQAAAGELSAWRDTAKGRLAEVIVLDQFSRNIHRGTAAAFSQDAMALALSQEAIRSGALNTLNETERSFLLMPWMHSESKTIHEQAAPLFKQYTASGSYDFELKHKQIIDRFGRYPHRNEALGRTSNKEEMEFLKQPNSSF